MFSPYLSFRKKSLSKDRLSFARSGLTVCLGTKEPVRVASRTEAMHIPVQSMPVDTSTTEDHNAGDNGNFISFCNSYLGTQITVLSLQLLRGATL
jgi:hypothetical protein